MRACFTAPRFQIQQAENILKRDLKGYADMSAAEMSGFDVFPGK